MVPVLFLARLRRDIELAAAIDAANCPQFVQLSVGAFAQGQARPATADALTNRARCDQADCPVFASCARVPLETASYGTPGERRFPPPPEPVTRTR